jgi:uncharacterized membrane protein YczE
MQPTSDALPPPTEASPPTATPSVVRRLPRLLHGLTLCGLGIALMDVAELGLGPWDVLHKGLSNVTGVPFGTVGIVVGALLLLLWIPLGERPGIGTVANVLWIGATIDVVLLVLPVPEALWLRIVAMALGPLLFGIGTGYYLGVALGPGPRDGLMTGIARRGPSVAVARTGIELTALAAGAALGGTVGVGTVVFALSIGPVVGWTLPRLSLPEVAQQREARVG